MSDSGRAYRHEDQVSRKNRGRGWGRAGRGGCTISIVFVYVLPITIKHFCIFVGQNGFSVKDSVYKSNRDKQTRRRKWEWVSKWKPDPLYSQSPLCGQVRSLCSLTKRDLLASLYNSLFTLAWLPLSFKWPQWQLVGQFAALLYSPLLLCINQCLHYFWLDLCVLAFCACMCVCVIAKVNSLMLDLAELANSS